jgi:3-hydroxyacyl-CoA dehydrogenase/enoyl-CoA hydratase/3-hydroxybutyryl-CoA epimerase
MNYRHLRIDATNKEWITVWLDARDRTLNVLFEEFFEELRAVFEVVKADPSQRPLILRSAKDKGFVVGADIKRIINIHTDAEIQAFMKLGQDVFRELEQLPNVTIAWISGACLGGGLELALACRYRIVLDAPETRLGMPESKLGLTPGWGGTHRLVRRVGLKRGLEMLMTGAPIIAKVALEYGLADGLWKAQDEIDPQIERWVSQLHNASAPPVSIDFSELWDELAKERHELRTAGLANDQHWQIPARQAIERAVELGIKESPAAAERLEREGFFELLNRPEVQSTLTLFSAPRKN